MTEHFEGRPLIPAHAQPVEHVVPSGTTDASRQQDFWLLRSTLKHPSLREVYDVGTSTAGVEQVRSIAEPSDGTLADSLETGPVDQKDTLEIVTTILECLEYLHARALVCCQIEPRHIHAVAGQTKFDPEHLRSVSEEWNPSTDMYAMGRLVTSIGSDGSNATESIPHPKLRTLAVACLDPNASKRPTATEALNILRAPDQPSRLGLRKLAVMAALLVSLSVVIYSWRSNESDAAVQPVIAEDRPSPIANEHPMLPKRSRTSPNMAARSTVQRGTDETLPAREEPATQTRTRSDGASDWAVIAATYNGFSAAAKRASSLRSQFPDCSCSVFPPEGEGLRYYVVVGSGMTSEVAEALRQRAVTAGLPHDAYVTKIAVRPSEPQ